MHDNSSIALWSLLVFFYYQFLTFALGFSLFPKKARLHFQAPWNYFAAWAIGFSLLTCSLVLLGTFWRIDQGSLLLTQLVFWLIILLNAKKLPFTHPKAPKTGSHDFHAEWRSIFLLPVLVIFILVFLSCLVPPTKIDEISHQIYYTKLSVVEEGFRLHYSPFLALFYMAPATYNIWSYAWGAEYTSALNSFFYHLLSFYLLFSWAKQRFGDRPALLTALIAFCAPIKIIDAMAPGGNTANNLWITALMLLSYEIYGETKEVGADADEKRITKLSLLSLVSCLALVTKLTSLALVFPILFSLYLYLLLKLRMTIKQWFFVLLPCLVLVPFLLRACTLYHNPFFPLGGSWFGAGPFEANSMKNFIASQTPKRDLLEFLQTPFLYMTKGPANKIIHPLSWLFAFIGFLRMARQKVFYAVLGIGTCYVISAFKLPYAPFRYFVGLIDFLTLLGIVEIFDRTPPGWKALIEKFMKTLTVVLGCAIAFAAVIYTKQFMVCLFTKEDRNSFLKPRVECSETIRWINEHLPKESFFIVETQGRYYYQTKTESLRPTILGKRDKDFKSYEEFYAFLKNKKVTHLMTVEFYTRPPRRDSYFRFCQTADYAKKIYENSEVVNGHRWGKPEYGKATLYQLI